MAKLHRLTVLMLLVILVITGFQLYWLKDNYTREKASLHIKADDIFQQVVNRVEDSTLQNKIRLAFKTRPDTRVHRTRLNAPGGTKDSISIEYNTFDDAPGQPLISNDSSHKVIFNTGSGPSELKEIAVVKRQGFTTSEDSPRIDGRLNHSRMRVLAQTIERTKPDPNDTSAGSLYFIDGANNKVMISIDSLLGDSIPLQLLKRNFTTQLRKAKINIDFDIKNMPKDKPLNNAPAAGLSFARSLRYNYNILGETRYLLSRISMPILFSIFLIGLTIVSFILLYRTLLQQERLAQSRSDLVSNITHELKTPIATVSVAIEALKNFSAINNREKTEEYLNISQQELQRLDLLVDKVLKLSMFESKDIFINKKPLDLGILVKEVGSSLRLQIEKANTELNIESHGDLKMNGDRQHLQSVIFNLLDNSLKYNEGKSIVIKVALKGFDDHIEISVGDNGIGIAETYHNKIFEKFFRVPTGDTHNSKGHGLGLSYVASIVKQHNGTISVQSSEGMGSKFTISLPKQSHVSH